MISFKLGESRLALVVSAICRTTHQAAFDPDLQGTHKTQYMKTASQAFALLEEQNC
jgi:hypothetical protein